MTQQELFKQHKIKCKNCTLKDKCDGIHLTINNTTKCERGEVNESNNNTIHK
jgi:hypothetical protein